MKHHVHALLDRRSAHNFSEKLIALIDALKYDFIARLESLLLTDRFIVTSMQVHSRSFVVYCVKRSLERGDNGPLRSANIYQAKHEKPHDFSARRGRRYRNWRTLLHGEVSLFQEIHFQVFVYLERYEHEFWHWFRPPSGTTFEIEVAPTPHMIRSIRKRSTAVWI